MMIHSTDSAHTYGCGCVLQGLHAADPKAYLVFKGCVLRGSSPEGEFDQRA